MNPQLSCQNTEACETLTISFEDRVAIVTGAGNGSSRAHAIGLAARGAKVVVNDLGAARDGSGGSSAAAEKVVEEIRAAGGQAIADRANVADFAQVQAMTAMVRRDERRVLSRKRAHTRSHCRALC